MASHYPDSRKTGQQLRTETIDAMDAAIAASGLADGWRFGYGPDAEEWNAATEEFIGAGCTTQPGNRGQRFQVDLYHEPGDDPVAFATKMAEFWESQGFTVSVVAGVDLGPRHLTHFRADRADGSLHAAVMAHTTSFNLSVYSECSTDPSLDKFAGPDGYRKFNDSDPDPYHPTNSPRVTPYPRD